MRRILGLGIGGLVGVQPSVKGVGRVLMMRAVSTEVWVTRLIMEMMLSSGMGGNAERGRSDCCQINGCGFSSKARDPVGSTVQFDHDFQTA